MLKSIRLQNFFGFQDCTINLEKGANVLVGINGSGKSNFFKAILLLKEGIAGKGYRKQINDFGGFDEIVNHSSILKQVEIDFEFDSIELARHGFNFSGSIHYQLSINRVSGSSNYSLSEKLFAKKRGASDFIYLDFFNGTGVVSERNTIEGKQSLVRYKDLDPQLTVLTEISDPERYYPINSFRKAIQKKFIYRYFDTSTDAMIRKAVPSVPSLVLEENGWNLAQILDTIELNNNSFYQEILTHTQNVNRHFKTIRAQNVAGNLQLVMIENSLDKATTASNISDGTLKFLCLMAIFYNPNRGSVVCIDEPELGLHPDMINTLYEAIDYASKTSQIIISTHSAQLLDLFELKNVRVFEKDENNATIVKQFEEKDFSAWADDYYAGKMWRSGVLGGNRW